MDKKEIEVSKIINGVAVVRTEPNAKMPMPNPHTGADQYTELAHTLYMEDGTVWLQCAEKDCDHLARSIQGITVGHLRLAHGKGSGRNPNGRLGKASDLLDTPFGDIIDAARQQLLGGDGLLDKLAQATQQRDEYKARNRALERELAEYKRTFAKLSS